MNIFVISLAGATDRRSEIQAQMSTLGLEFDFFDAVSIDDQEGYSPELQTSVNEFEEIVGRRPTLPEIGCALSHLEVLQKMVALHISHALILEDDAKIGSSLPDLLRDLLKHASWELALLGHWSLYRDSMRKGAEAAYFGKVRLSDSILARPAEFPLGAHAYVISYLGARKILQHFLPVRMPADYVTGGAERAGVMLRIVSPPVVTQRPGPSTIGRRHYPSGTRVSGTISMKLKAAIRFTLLLMRKLGLFRQSYVWVFCRKFR